ncbi:hypothetical protein [Pseudomonas sp. GL-B-19]|uniref:hypothetical protein n=1 Tax=Pseudomonas sp. GL-B-19 TaxID=2832393 RepID=UPI001CC108CE|nr:hypothetical protein [Pseudomonas sp. GL-B-19]
MATIKTNAEKASVKGDAMRHVEYGLPNPIAVIQRHGNDKTRTIDAQAGGFWLSRRQRRKVL